MLKKQHNKLSLEQQSKASFSQKEKEYLDLLCNFIVDIILNKVNDDKEEGNCLRKD